MSDIAAQRARAQSVVLPLALCQFIASYAATNMNVAISNIAHDLGTTVIGVQTAITLFTLTMAALMIPGSKLTDIWGRKFCFMLGLIVYGSGAFLAAVATGPVLLTLGYSLFEGVGSALMIPPIYIILTIAFSDTTSRARAFGIVSAAAGGGAAAGPLIGGLITSWISWRASFLAQVAVVIVILLISRRLPAARRPSAPASFDIGGAVLSAVGLFLVVFGVLRSGTYGWLRSRQDFAVGDTVLIHAGGLSPIWLFMATGGVVIAAFLWHVHRRVRAGKAPLISLHLFHSRASNFGLVTQTMQWLAMQGTFFVVSVFLQQVRHYSAIETGLALTPATIGILVSSARAARMAKRVAQRTIIAGGFTITIAGTALLLLLARAHSNIFTFVPGLFLIGVGVGAMLTASVNVVQSAFPEREQGEISGLSRSASNLGSSLGTAIAGSVLVSTLVEGNKHFVLALVTLSAFSVVGLVAALLLPRAQKR